MSFININWYNNVNVFIDFTFLNYPDVDTYIISVPVAVVVPGITLNANERYKVIKSKDDYISLFGPISGHDIYHNSIFYLSGKVDLYVYKNINDILETDNVFALMNNFDSSPTYIPSIESKALFLKDLRCFLFTNVRNEQDYNSLNSIADSAKENIVACYGNLYSGNYSVWSCAEFLYAMCRYIKNGLLFCGMRHVTNLRLENINRKIVGELLAKNVNLFIRKIAHNVVTLSNKLISDEISYTTVIKALKLALLSFIGYPNNENTWIAVHSTLTSILSFFASKKCASFRHYVIVDSTNNTPNSSTLYVEIQFTGALTHRTEVVRTVKLAINL